MVWKDSVKKYCGLYGVVVLRGGVFIGCVNDVRGFFYNISVVFCIYCDCCVYGIICGVWLGGKCFFKYI